MSKKKVIVVGAGINGLVISNYLSRDNFDVLLLEKSERVGGACVSDSVNINNDKVTFAKGATVLGMMPNFIFNETGLSDKVQIFSPDFQKIVYYESDDTIINIYKDPKELSKELHNKVGETGDILGFRNDENKVIEFIREGYRKGIPPNIEDAETKLGKNLVNLWIKGSARNLLDHYFTSDKTKLYMGMTVIESSPESIDSEGSAFTIPLMDSGSVFDGYWGYVKKGIWQITEQLEKVNISHGVKIKTSAEINSIDEISKKVILDNGYEYSYDVLVFATDPLTPSKFLDDQSLIDSLKSKKNIGTSGKVTAFFKNKVEWRDHSQSDKSLSSFRFIFSVDNLDEFEHRSINSLNGVTDYEPGYIQVYCEGAAQRHLGNHEKYDKLIFFTKNISYEKRGSDLDEVHEKIKQKVFQYIINPSDCVHSVFLTPKDMKNEFYFPGGNIDHVMLTKGQNFHTRNYRLSQNLNFYNLGNYEDIFYCGAGSYPCGSVAGTPGYMCYKQIK